jgi:hypothetical protein
MSEIKTEPANGTTTSEPMQENTPAQTQEPVKKDRRKKDPTEPTLVPFQLITPQNRERLARIGKADNNTLNALLDAYENKDTASLSDTDAAKEIIALKKQTQDMQSQLNAAHETINTLKSTNAQKEDKLNAEITALKQQISIKEQLIEEQKQQIAAFKQDNAAAQNTDSALVELKQKLQAMTDRATRAEDEVKDNRVTIDKLLSVKAELEKKVDKITQERDTAQAAYLNTERQETPIAPVNIYPEGDILHFFPTITARMLDVTAKRLSQGRKDGNVITPQMVLADMFNKYTIQRLTNWFYWPVLNDTEIVEIAQDSDSRLTNIRMVKAALNIN